MHVRRERWPALALARVALVLAASGGVVLQWWQAVDPTFFLLYFTVWCAILSAGAAAANLAGLQPVAAGWVRDASCVGAVLSGGVYATVLMPASRPALHDGAPIWAASLLLHLVVPALAVSDFLRAPRALEPTWPGAATWTLLPAAYLAVLLVLAVAGQVRPAYSILDPASFGWPGVVASCLAGTGTYVLLATLLIRWRRRRLGCARQAVA